MAQDWTRAFGAPMGDWSAPPAPGPDRIVGNYMRLERLETRHAHGLYAAFGADERIWDYMPHGPFHSEPTFICWVNEAAGSRDPLFYAAIELETERLFGVMAYMRISPAIGSIELGSIALSSAGQGTRAGSEAMMRMIEWAFEAGYRRFEWKCDALNLASRRAAQRLGLSHEGVFRQATHYKGRNRDTAWFAAIDKDWPALKAAYDTWLARTNFDTQGRQIKRLSDLTRLVRVSDDPKLV